MLLPKSFINHILLISKRLVEGFVPEIGLVVCLWLIVVSCILNFFIPKGWAITFAQGGEERALGVMYNLSTLTQKQISYLTCV